MAVDSFPDEVVEELKHYVYRLIDPRNGETFYVGKGRGNRVFDHANAALTDPGESAADPKLERIHEIQGLGMRVQHVIHRHGMTEATAREVEAALIDAYPGLVNRVAGTDSRDRGARHVDEIILEHSADEFVVEKPLILISIGQLWKVRGVYGAVRGVWRMNKQRAEGYKLVLAHVRGVVRGAYIPTRWMRMQANSRDFPFEAWESNPESLSKRIGFDGVEAERAVWDRYVGKRVPAKYRKRGVQTPFQYLHPCDVEGVR